MHALVLGGCLRRVTTVTTILRDHEEGKVKKIFYVFEKMDKRP